MELNKVASTSKLCAWNKSRKQVETALLVNISFNRSKGDELVPNVLPSNIDELRPFCTVDPVRNSAKIRQKLLQLKQIAPNVAVLTSTSLESDDTYDSETDSADEVDPNCIPEPLGSLSEPRTINFDRQKLISYSKEVYEEYKRSYTKVHYDNLCDQTKKQGLSDAWKIHRIGRITASVSKLAFTTKVESPSKTFINTVMQYKPSTDVAATKYGKVMEPVAFHAFTEYFRLHHKNTCVSQTGLNVNAEFPHLGASPDGVPVSSNGCMDEGHPYYYQLQHQMLVTGLEKNYFYIWTKAKTDNFMLITVQKDNDFLKKLTEKFDHLFEVVILPELVSRKSDVDNTENEKLYCICQRPSFLPMIACDGTNCKIEWFHYACVKIKKAPRNNWYCEECKSKRKMS